MNTIEKKSVNAGKSITKQEVDNLVRAYKQERWADNSERIGMADSLSVWFSVEELENFVETVKANGGNGVRMHFGVFSSENAPQAILEGRQTLVMIGNRSSDGTHNTSKELYSYKNGQPEIVASVGSYPCPPICGSGPGKASDSRTMGSATLLDRGEKGMSVI
ncbi:MAG TPA: hypothetical protein VNV35_11325 [Puia sp.]|jgi:hypothetical protein|nr:hypothetical protein [Puia sp.]